MFDRLDKKQKGRVHKLLQSSGIIVVLIDKIEDKINDVYYFKREYKSIFTRSKNKPQIVNYICENFNIIDSKVKQIEKYLKFSIMDMKTIPSRQKGGGFFVKSKNQIAHSNFNKNYIKLVKNKMKYYEQVFKDLRYDIIDEDPKVIARVDKLELDAQETLLYFLDGYNNFRNHIIKMLKELNIECQTNSATKS